jgi:uncharacterized LabA/DUF88 family protein
MIKKYITGRVYAFIDIANIFYSQKTFGWKISYKKLKKYLEEECDLQWVSAYTGVFSGDDNQKRFLDLLDILGYRVVTKPVKKIVPKKGSVDYKANFDIEIAFDMIDNIENYDTALLFSGDSDFAVVLDRIKAKGKKVLVFSTRGHISLELIKRAKYIDLRKLKDFICLEK